MAEKYTCSDEVKQKVAVFSQSDAAFKAAWDSFEQRHATEIAQLEGMREDRNSKLDDAKRALRDEATEADITKVKVISIGPFKVQKKWQSFYIPEKFVARLETKNLYDSAIKEKIVAEKVEVAKFDEVKAFLVKAGVDVEFEDCEDGKEMTPAVFGPKVVGALGAEFKET